MVTLCPLKWRLAPLNETTSFLQPWWPVSSQYLRWAIVQSLKWFWAISLNIPAEATNVSVQVEELPSAVLLLAKQLSKVQLRPALLPHHPPPQKLSKNLVDYFPSMMQQAPLVPSRHSASGSVSTTFLSVCAAKAREIIAKKTKYLLGIVKMQDLLINLYNKQKSISK